MNAVKVLREARSLCFSAWAQKPIPAGHDCALSAIFVAAYQVEPGHDEREARDLSVSQACKALTDAIGEPSITRWNDKPGRAKPEVLAAFDKAIALAEERERAP